MKTFGTTMTTSYEWWREDQKDILNEMIEILKEDAEIAIKRGLQAEMIKGEFNYVQGELNYVHRDNKENVIAVYRGWWKSYCDFSEEVQSCIDFVISTEEDDFAMWVGNDAKFNEELVNEDNQEEIVEEIQQAVRYETRELAVELINKYITNADTQAYFGALKLVAR